MITTLDLSTVTDRLVDILETAVTDSRLWAPVGAVTRFNISVSGSMPEEVRNKGGCQLSVYLFHLNTQPFTRNMNLTASAASTNKQQPLGLTLFYLLSAYAKENPQQEQQAMSIAIKALHERGTYVDPGMTFTITMEEEKQDEANRRWQAYSTPFRLSTVYRVSVVFLSPDEEPAEPAEPPRIIRMSLGPAGPDFARAGWLSASASRTDFTSSPAAPGAEVLYEYSPALVCPGGALLLLGEGLNLPSSQRLYLIDPGGVETEVTDWREAIDGQASSRLSVNLPSGVGTPPGASPQPGVYLLRVGSSVAQGDEVDYRSNSVPVSIAARADTPPTPWLPAADVYSFSGAGFIDGQTELLLDTVGIEPIAPGDTPGPGEFAISPAGDSISFRPPTFLGSGTYSVRLRVKGVEGPPVGEVVLP